MDSLKLLVISGDIEDIQHIQQCLSESNLDFELTEGLSSAEAIDLLQNNEFDCLILDNELRDGSGEDLLEKIQKFNIQVPVTMISNEGDELFAVKALSKGASDYIPKSVINPSSLSRTIKNAIRVGRAHIDAEKARLELNRKNIQLSLATRAKTRFLANMSHEIRTPMNAILGVADLLAETQLNPEQKNYVDVFQREGENLLELINDILDFSKIESGKMELEPEPVDLRHFLSGIARMFGARVAERSIDFFYEISEDAPQYVSVDSLRLRQVLTNLIGNALKFVERGFVKLKVKYTKLPDGEGGFTFSVEDTGPGIEEERREAIFRSFEQADNSITRKHGGTGLGLAISSQLVRQMGGQLKLESEVNKGSKFWFEVILHEVSEKEFQKIDRKTTQKTVKDESLPNMHVLLAEDTFFNAQLIKAFLNKTKINLKIVENGTQAVEYFNKHHPDLILMDVQMPEMDGLTATQEIRKLEKEGGLQRTPIWALTAHVFHEDVRECIEAGCDAHLSKPIRKAVLLKKIADLVSHTDFQVGRKTS